MTDFFGAILLRRVAEELFDVGDGLRHAIGGRLARKVWP
jgi:hypothetical protein